MRGGVLSRRALIGALAAAPASADTLAGLQRRGEIRLGLHVDDTAMAADPIGRGPLGLAASIGRLLAEGLDLRPRFHASSGASHVEMLLRDEFDVLINPVPMNIPMAREVMFASPYARLELVIVAPRARRLSSLHDLAGQRVGLIGGRGQHLLVAGSLVNMVEPVLAADWRELAELMAAGGCDALLVLNHHAERIIQAMQSVEEKLHLGSLWVAPALRYGAHDLMRVINAQLLVLRETGLLAELHRSFLHLPLPEPPAF
jgi:ABC-type amino acid transport substrate-binding protein